MSPNPEIVSQSKEQEVDRSLLKIIILALFGISTGVLTVYFFNRSLLSGGSGNFFLTFLFGVLFFAVNVIYVFFIKSAFKIRLILLLETILPLGFFYKYFFPEPPIALIVGAAAFFIFSSLATGWGVRFLGNSLKVHFWLIARTVLPKIITGFLIFLSAIFYFNYFRLGLFNENLGRQVVFKTLNSSNVLLRVWFSDLSFDKPVDVFLKNIVTVQLKQIKSNLFGGMPSDFEESFMQLPPAAQDKIIDVATENLITSLEVKFGKLNVKDSAQSEIFRIIKNYFNQLPLQAKSLVGIASAALFFFSLKGLFSLFYWLFIFFAYLIFKFLIITGFGFISVETRSREFVLLK